MFLQPRKAQYWRTYALLCGASDVREGCREALDERICTWDRFVLRLCLSKRGISPDQPPAGRVRFETQREGRDNGVPPSA